jgi:DNA invertase Pin-like site-specific DNA recombinase
MTPLVVRFSGHEAHAGSTGYEGREPRRCERRPAVIWRVSTRDQNIEGQRDALEAAGCEAVFVDSASRKLASRPALEKALLSMNRAEDQHVVTKLDRLGRSLDNLIELSKQLQRQGVDLVVLDQGIDTSTSLGTMFFQILGSIAEFEHSLMV